MSDKIFDAVVIDIPCGYCGHSSQRSIQWLRETPSYKCEKCGVTEFDMTNEKFRQKIDEAEKSVKDFLNNIKKMGGG